jgi:hypothetical protein
MKTESEPALDPSEELLDHAIRAAMTQPAPEDTRQRVLDTAVALGRSPADSDPCEPGPTNDPRMPAVGNVENAQTTQTTSSHFRRPDRWRLAALVTIVAAATVMLWLTSAKESWAQVVDALRKQPWSLSKYTTPDGELHEEWVSFSRDVSAFRHGDLLRFTDHRLNVTYVYNTKERTLTRQVYSDGKGKKGGYQWFEAVFQQMSAAADKLAYSAPGVEVVEQKRGSVTKHQRNWLSFELVVRAADPGGSNQKSNVHLIFLVDPQTRLPHYLTMSEPNMQPPSVEMELSYPERGPIDIYDLGVPRDAKLIDLVPTDDIQRILAGIKASAERFEPHQAFNVMSDSAASWHIGTPFVVWRRGTSNRLVFGLVDSDSVIMASPAPNTDHKQWWKRRWTELFHVPHEISDGSTFWTNEAQPAGWGDQPNKPNPLKWKRASFPKPKWKSRPEQVPWPAGSAPLYFAYPQNLVQFRSIQSPIIVETTHADGPKNTVKVIVRWESAGNSTGEDRYWIDTQRSYMVVRHEMVNFDSTQKPPIHEVQLSHVVEMAEQSPSGIWYPSLVRHSSKGKEQITETLTRHYLDFDVKFPDDVFKPIERPGEPLE